MVAVFIVAAVFAFVILMTKMGMDYSKEKSMLGYGPSENSLRMSELRELIRDAVQEANRPLLARVAELEEEVQRMDKRLPDSEKAPHLLKESPPATE